MLKGTENFVYIYVHSKRNFYKTYAKKAII